MRNGCPRDKSETTVEEQLQTPDVFIPDDFEDEDIESAAEQLRPMWQKDRLLCENERLRSLKWHYSFGKKIAKHYDAVKKDRESYGKTVYGERYFKRVADAVNARAKKRVSWQLLQGCYALVGTYTEEAFAELCEHEEITPSHAISLAYIKLDDVRPQLQAEADRGEMDGQATADGTQGEAGRSP